ncbi:DNA/RNA nuclease SfsA [Subdoligranulum sp. DSM 109015]|uniref:Sugar fermentation stimulation protein homolog n=1 Tax=Gemmiger gallinarum TaxID=2779354 RepID=A0ABR9R1R9_9FIRM|nr:DNA/RNA nuclease SfsA [Gemmiger gallinarum]MBE5037048.1 DNA/RNA nuclease SfsA [Gemmiger gallinarum]
MQYQHVKEGRFLSRPNRFVARVLLDGAEEVVHVKNTGRCRELLLPGARVYLALGDNPQRKTRYDLIAVEKGPLLVNMDSQATNRVFGEWAGAGHFRAGLTLLRPETVWGNSRFDFYWEDASGCRGFVEVKGVTLEEKGHARFPDAPTLRGVKHLEELARCRAEGCEAAVCFVLQMGGMKDFAPNDVTHPAFGDALRRAAAGGVNVLAMECAVTPDSLIITHPVPVRL